MAALPGQPSPAANGGPPASGSPPPAGPGRRKLKRSETKADLQRKENSQKAYEKIQLKGAVAMEQGPTAALHQVWKRLDTNGNGLLSWNEFSGVSATLGVQWDLKTAWDDAIEIMELHEADRLLRERLAAAATAQKSTAATGGQSSTALADAGRQLTADESETQKMAERRNRGRERRGSVLTIWEDPDIDSEEKARRAKEAAKHSWKYNLAHLRDKETDAVAEISFRAFVSVYNETMGQARRRVRLEIKTMFERMVHDTRGVSREGFNRLCSRNSSRLYLLAPGWDSSGTDWKLLLELSGLGDRAEDSDMTASWTEFERWWKHRMGLIEADTPVIPEFFEFKMEELSMAERTKRDMKRRAAAKKLPTALMMRVGGKEMHYDLSSLVSSGFDEHRTGKDLWDLLRPRLRMLLTMRREWGNIDDIYGHTDSTFGQVPVPWYIRDPDSKFSGVWDILQVMFLMYVSWTVPLRACFGMEIEIPSTEWVIDTIVDLYFIVDLFLNFSTAFVDGNGVRQSSRRVIIRTYLRGWFAIDLVSCIPMQYITMALQEKQGVGEGNNYRVFKALRLVRLSKMLRLARIKRMMEKYEGLEVVQNYGGIVMLCYGIFFIAHVLSCLWYMVGLTDDYLTSSGALISPGWVLKEWCSDACELGESLWGEATGLALQQGRQSPPLCGSFGSTEACGGFVAVDRCLWSNSESKCEPRKYCTLGCELEGSPELRVRYITSLWSVFGSIDPDVAKTPPERFFAVFAYVCLVIIDGAVAGVLSALMISMGGKEREVNDRLRSAKQWMREQRIPKLKAQKALDYFRLVYKSRVMYEENEILSTMPPAMKLDFASHLYFKFLSVVPLFTGLPTALLHSLCTIMEPMLAVHGQVIYTQGSSGTEMYMLLSGELEITHINGLGQSERLGFLSDGAFFGETPILDNTSAAEIRRRTVTAVTDCKLCFISKKNMVSLKEIYPELALRLMRCTRTEKGRVNKKSKKYRAALGAAGITKFATQSFQEQKALKEKNHIMQNGGGLGAPAEGDDQHKNGGNGIAATVVRGVSTTAADTMSSLLSELKKTESLVEERHTHDSVRLSNLESMMKEQGRVLLMAVKSLDDIKGELEMRSIQMEEDPAATFTRGL